MPLTIVTSDLHGHGVLLTNALAHAGFGPSDRLIVAGDLVDGGPDDCIALAERHGAEILAGNHEASAALGLPISPQDPETPARGPGFLGRFLSGEWPLAAQANGWLITHAGVSRMFDGEVLFAGFDAGRLAEDMNARFVEELVVLDSEDEEGMATIPARIVIAQHGPLWFRPHGPEWIPPRMKQVAGHTAPELLPQEVVEQLAGIDFLLCDPHARGDSDPARRYRYVAIEEDGTARLREGELTT